MDNSHIQDSFYEKTARNRIQALFDKHSFAEILKPGSTPNQSKSCLTGYRR